MVRVGFIVEGATEKIILEHSGFFNYLDSLKIAYVPEVINAEGSGNLLPQNIESYVDALLQEGATNIFVLTDLDSEQCITNTRKRIGNDGNHTVIVSIKTIEAWFLSDTEAMRKYFNDPGFNFEHPEMVNNPFEEIKLIRKIKTGKGFNNKKVLANTLVHKMGFSILSAAKHPNCNSAKYFLKMIAQVAATN